MTSHKIVQNQEILCDILFVLEEIVNKALYMCYSNDIKKKTVLFMVRCAYQAMLQLLDLNFYVHEIVQNQEILCDILFVLEEIVNKALYMCYSNDIKKKTVLFMVRCAYQAMLQLLDLNFYVHDPGRNDFSSDPDWIPDELPAPSPPDTPVILIGYPMNFRHLLRQILGLLLMFHL
ncbi:hypothetical protein QE152_g12471 [Popillia japonica]|uniref:Uncharacterized protein n=1 Tax=Popillia japonica TaxID=7064 RepID=A0AAW1LR19_POPJA